MTACSQKLMEDRVILQRRRESFKKLMQRLTLKYEGLKSQLNENETFTQVRQCVCHDARQFLHGSIVVGGSFFIVRVRLTQSPKRQTKKDAEGIQPWEVLKLKSECMQSAATLQLCTAGDENRVKADT